MICELQPVSFVQPCLAGREERDIDRKRAAGLALATWQLTRARLALHLGSDRAERCAPCEARQGAGQQSPMDANIGI